MRKKNPLLRSLRPWRYPTKPKKRVEKRRGFDWRKAANSGKANALGFAVGCRKRSHLVVVTGLYIYLFSLGSLNLITALSLGFVSLVLADHLLENLLDYKSRIKNRFSKKPAEEEISIDHWRSLVNKLNLPQNKQAMTSLKNKGPSETEKSHRRAG